MLHVQKTAKKVEEKQRFPNMILKLPPFLGGEGFENPIMEKPKKKFKLPLKISSFLLK